MNQVRHGKVVTFVRVLSGREDRGMYPSCARLAFMLILWRTTRGETRRGSVTQRGGNHQPCQMCSNHLKSLTQRDADSATKSPTNGRRKRKSPTRILQSACKLCKPNGRRICLEDRVHVLEKDVPDDPRGIRGTIQTDPGHVEYTADTHLIRV